MNRLTVTIKFYLEVCSKVWPCECSCSIEVVGFFPHHWNMIVKHSAKLNVILTWTSNNNNNNTGKKRIAMNEQYRGRGVIQSIQHNNSTHYAASFGINTFFGLCTVQKLISVSLWAMFTVRCAFTHICAPVHNMKMEICVHLAT